MAETKNNLFVNNAINNGLSSGENGIYTTFFEHAPDGIVLVKEGVICLVNPKFARMVGHSADKLVKHYLTKVVSPDSLYRIEQRYRNIVLGERVPSKFRIELISRNGTIVPVEANTTFIEFNGGVADLVFLREIE